MNIEKEACKDHLNIKIYCLWFLKKFHYTFILNFNFIKFSNIRSLCSFSSRSRSVSPSAHRHDGGHSDTGGLTPSPSEVPHMNSRFFSSYWRTCMPGNVEGFTKSIFRIINNHLHDLENSLEGVIESYYLDVNYLHVMECRITH